MSETNPYEAPKQPDGRQTRRRGLMRDVGARMGRGFSVGLGVVVMMCLFAGAVWILLLR